MNRIFRIVGLTSSTMILSLFALSACDEVGDYESDPRSIEVVIDEEPGTDDGGDPPRDDGECECVCPSTDPETEEEEDPDDGNPGKGKKPEKGEKGNNGKGKNGE